jgi:hypothetical protein
MNRVLIRWVRTIARTAFIDRSIVRRSEAVDVVVAVSANAPSLIGVVRKQARGPSWRTVGCVPGKPATVGDA